MAFSFAKFLNNSSRIYERLEDASEICKTINKRFDNLAEPKDSSPSQLERLAEVHYHLFDYVLQP